MSGFSGMAFMRVIALIVFISASVFPLVSESAPATDSDSESALAQAQNRLPGEVEKKAWISAIGNDRAERLTQLQNHYALSVLLKLTAPNGKSALMVASKKGDMALASSLIEGGASVNDTTDTQGSAFMFAVLGNQHEMAEWLLEQGADINVVGSNGWTALTIAAAKGYEPILSWLIASGADAQIRDIYRYTPFLRAVDNGFLDTAKRLLMLPDTDVNAQDEFDNTALHHAVAANNAAMVRLLLAHGARVNLENRHGIKALDLANGVTELEALLHH